MSVRSSKLIQRTLRSRFATSVTDGIKLESEKLLWITPIHHYKLSHNVHHSIHSELCELTSTEYTKFINAKQYKSEDDPSVINNEFFQHQGAYIRTKTNVSDDAQFILNGGWSELERSESFKTLKQYIYACIVSYFKQCIKSEQELEALLSKTLTAYCWVSVHLNDSQHPSHTHADSIVSGVYYIRVPEDNSHQISFQDPKGTDLYHPESTFDLRPPPFDNEWIFTPSAGDIIFFPSWLPHRVLPSEASAKDRVGRNSSSNIDFENISRLSLAINVLGSWKHNASKHV